MMLDSVIDHQKEQLSIDEVSRQISAQILELCDAKLFSEPLNNSEITNNCCYEDNNNNNNNSLYAHLPLESIDKFPYYQDNNSGNTDTTPTIITTPTCSNIMTTTSTSTAAAKANNTSISDNNMIDLQQDIDNGISAGSINISTASTTTFSEPPSLIHDSTQQDQFALLSSIGAFILPSVTEEDWLSSIPCYMHLNASSSPCFLGNNAIAYEFQQLQELEFNPGGDLQGLSTVNQQVVIGSENTTCLTQDIPNTGDQTFKVGKLSAEERKEKIHRYMKKRNERNFTKKIKYACRKTLADSRPRVRGRFAKNDEFGVETPSSNHEDQEEDEEVVKEDDDNMLDSSDIFSHITGVNSFKCNFSIHSLSNY